MLDPAGWAQVGPWGIVTIVVLCIIIGLLIPRWTHNQRIKDKNEIITLQKETIAKRDEQVDRLIEQNDLMIRLLEDIKAAGRPAGSRTGPK